MTMCMFSGSIILIIGMYTIQALILTSHKHVKNRGIYMVNIFNDDSQLYKSDIDINLDTQIYCNVELNTDYIEAVGFDMDFTLAQVSP